MPQGNPTPYLPADGDEDDARAERRRIMIREHDAAVGPPKLMISAPSINNSRGTSTTLARGGVRMAFAQKVAQQIDMPYSQL